MPLLLCKNIANLSTEPNASKKEPSMIILENRSANEKEKQFIQKIQSVPFRWCMLYTSFMSQDVACEPVL